MFSGVSSLSCARPPFVVGGSLLNIEEGKAMEQPTQAVIIASGRCPAFHPPPASLAHRLYSGGAR